MIREAIALVEKYISNSSAEKEWVLASKAFMPLTPTIMKEFQQEIDVAFHVTDSEGLKTLKNIQGQKKEISTFRRGDEGISMGARRAPEYLIELSGTSSFDGDIDIYSQLSRNGHKWLDPFRTDKDYVVNNKFSVPMYKKLNKYFGVKDRHEIISKAEDMNGKEKAEFIKWYYDESKKLITKKLLDEIKIAIANKRRFGSGWNSDEWFLHKIKIKSVKIITNKWDDEDEDYSEKEEFIKKLGLKFSGFISPKEIAKIDVN